jgi:hypothetical protein
MPGNNSSYSSAQSRAHCSNGYHWDITDMLNHMLDQKPLTGLDKPLKEAKAAIKPELAL